MGMKSLGLAAFGAASLVLGATAASAGDYSFAYVMHSTTSNAFWGAVNKGMVAACTDLKVDCQMVTLRTDGDLQEQLTNLQTVTAQGVDGIVTTLVDDQIFDDAVQAAIDAGIPVIAANVDDTEGAAGNARLSFIGQDLEQAGYDLGAGLSAQFPDGDIHVLIGVADFSQNWAVQRGNGVARFMQDYADANPDRNVTWEQIETTLDGAVVASRFAAYVQANPGTVAYFDVGIWHADAAKAMRDLGMEAGDILLAGFDLVPSVFDEMTSGFIQLTIDQQPYLQGYLPIVQLYMMNEFKLGPWDVNTGKAFVVPEDVPELMELSRLGIR